MLEFAAFYRGKKSRTFKASSMNTIYSQYNNYCKTRGFTKRVQVPLEASYGGLAWTNGGAENEVILLRPISHN